MEKVQNLEVADWQLLLSSIYRSSFWCRWRRGPHSPDTSHAITSAVSATTGTWMPNKVAGERYWQAEPVKYTAVLRQIHPHENYTFLPFHTYCTQAHHFMHFSNRIQ